MMHDFFGFDEDLFSFKSEKSTCIAQYEALQCESEWFVADHSNEPLNMLIKIKYDADYKFFNGDYESAIKLYEDYMKCTNLSLTVERECIEGIARSYLGLHCYCKSLKHATELYNISSTFDSYTCSLTLLFQIYKAKPSVNYEDLVTVSQKLVNLHCTNSDVWLKLAVAYALHYGIHLTLISDLLSYSGKNDTLNGSLRSCKCCLDKSFPKLLSKNQTGKYKVLTCLLHCSFHLQSVQTSTLGFAKDKNAHLQNIVDLEIKNLLPVFYDIEKLTNCVKEIYTGVCHPVSSDNVQEKCTDKATSKFTNAVQVDFVLNNDLGEDFEKKWLIDYYCKM